MLALLFMACSFNTNPKSDSEAPFDIGRLTSQRWIQAPDTNTKQGQGVLVLSTEELGCDSLSTAGTDLDELVLKGQGLLFLLDYNSSEEDPHGEDWSGLWMGYASNADRGRRYMQVLAFNDGFLYFLDGYYSYGGGSWLNINADSDGLSGSYQADSWSGNFKSESCGDWTPSNPDTGWDTFR